MLVIACNLNAIPTGDRGRYRALIDLIRAAIRGREPMADGYAFTLDSTVISLLEVAEWMNLERLCCPFFNLELSATGSQRNWRLALTGPAGVKELLDAEFPFAG